MPRNATVGGRNVAASVDQSLRKAATLASQGQPVAAARMVAEVLDRFPKNARARAVLADIQRAAAQAVTPPQLAQLHGLVAAGRAGEALNLVRMLKPAAAGSADLQAILGQAALAQRRPQDAVDHFRIATLLAPAHPGGWVGLGNAAYLAEDWAEAERAFRAAVQITPKNADILNNLGMALAARRDFAAAEEVFARAAAIDARSAKVAYNRANALRDAGRLEEAIAEYRRALALQPDYAVAANNLGTVLHQLGRDREAEAAYLAAVQAKPDYAQAHRNLSAVHRYAADDPLVPVLDDGLAKAREPRDVMYLSFARSKAAEDAGDHDRAFDLLVQANGLRKQLIGYDIAVDRLLFSRLTELFAEPLPPLDAAPANPRPVFVLGMMRSGTTLVEQILSSHSAVHGAGELETLGQLCLPLMEAFHAEGRRPDAAALTALRDSYLAGLSALSGGAPVVTDKMPVNFRWIGFILAALPEARILHLRRDPVATCWSIFKHYFSSDGNGYAFDLQDVAAYWHLYTGLMDHWHRLYPGRILDVPYEALTEDPEGWSRRIVDFAGLEWEAACLDFHLNSRAVRTASASQVKQKIYRGSSEAWRAYEGRLAPLVAALKG